MKNNKSTLTVILGLFFVGMGSYRLYQKFILNENISNFQWIASIFLVGFGLYRLYQYFNASKKEA